MDEPFFLAIARQILRDPAHPLSFSFNWYGAAAPMAALNNTPPLFPYLLAVALKLSGGGEFWTRALFFPFDLIAAWALLALATRFLKNPLWPVLLVLSGPGWALNMPHLMAERVMAPFAVAALCLAVLAFDDGDESSFRASAVLASAALLTKYNAVFLVPVVLVYGFTRGARPARLAAWAAVALLGLPVGFLLDRAFGADAGAAAWTVLSQSSRGIWSAPSHQLRAVLAFIGGLCLPAALWSPFLRPGCAAAAAAGAAAAAVFVPALDLAPLVRPVDRATGFLLAWGVLVALVALYRGPRTRGSALWAAWIGAVVLLQCAYWSVMARFIVLLTPALVFWLWERLETERPAVLGRLAPATFALTLVLTGLLGAADLTYAAVQRVVAREAVLDLKPGKRMWFAGHWGLQEYLSAAGGVPLDADAGGWDAVASGDLVVVPTVNSNILRPRRPLAVDLRTLTEESRLPLRLITARKGEAGFYTDVTGFLPWSISDEPLDSVDLVRRR